MDYKTQKLLDQLRRLLILALGLIEDARGMERTIKSHNERRKAKRK